MAGWTLLTLRTLQGRSSGSLLCVREPGLSSPRPAPPRKKERSLSVNSYLLSPSHALSPPTTPRPRTADTSTGSSPRNFSLPANKLFFFPPGFSTELAAVSRKTSSERSSPSPRPCSPARPSSYVVVVHTRYWTTVLQVLHLPPQSLPLPLLVPSPRPPRRRRAPGKLEPQGKPQT